jgi:hypothetical protein
VSLTVAGVDATDGVDGIVDVERSPVPDVELIRDVWVRELNRLGGAPPP